MSPRPAKSLAKVNIFISDCQAGKWLNAFIPPENESQIESGSEGAVSLEEAALHTLWDAEAAKEILLKIVKKPGLGVFEAIRSTWGKGVEIRKAVKAHIDGMYDSGYAEPCRGGGGIFDMLYGTRQLAEKLLEAKEYDAAFFFAHEVATMMRRCEGSETHPDDEEDVIKWAKALDVLMAEAVKGWRKQAGNSKKQKAEVATLVKEIETGESAKDYDQKKWYPNTLTGLRAWAK